MRSITSLLLLGTLALAAARRGRPPPGPREPAPTVADALDIRAPKEYLGKDWQAVMTMTPGSASRRTVSKETGKITGMRRRRGLMTYMKKREKYPWENPWAEPSEAPFKLRFLRQDPAGIVMSMEKQGKLRLQSASHKGKAVLGVGMLKPKPWYMKFFPDGKK